nr:retrovirus-related Pol polyprotein from transposon TNT 1-94 [Tanacetum cinerariifolium]
LGDMPVWKNKLGDLPVVYYRDNNNMMKRLTIEEFPEREKRAVATSNVNIIEYYIEGVTTIKSYLDLAFRSMRTNEAYLFFQNEYVVLDYALGTMNDRVFNGPLYIPNGFQSLIGTSFAAYRIDAAFDCHGGDDESFIFSGSTKFEKGVDAAFESSVPNEVYIFKGEEYALVDYIQQKLIVRHPIVDGLIAYRTLFSIATYELPLPRMATTANASRLAQAVNEIQHVENELRQNRIILRLFSETPVPGEPCRRGKPHPCDELENKGPREQTNNAAGAKVSTAILSFSHLRTFHRLKKSSSINLRFFLCRDESQSVYQIVISGGVHASLVSLGDCLVFSKEVMNDNFGESRVVYLFLLFMTSVVDLTSIDDSGKSSPRLIHLINNNIDLKDVSEDFQIKVECLLLVYSEPVKIFILVDRILELVHVNFRNICSDSEDIQCAGFDHDHYQEAACAHHEEHMMHDCVQLDHVVDSHDEYTSDSNIIMCDQYVRDNEVLVVHSGASSVPIDAFMMTYDDICKPHDQSVSYPSQNTVVKKSLTAELAIYKEHVELVAIGYKNPLCLTRAKQAQPALYNGHEIIKENHIQAIVHNSEDTLEINATARRKVLPLPESLERNFDLRRISFKSHFLSLFNSQKEMDHQYTTVAKIPVLDTGEQWQFWIQQYLQHEHNALWEVIKFDDSYRVPTTTDPNNTITRKDDEQSGRTVTITTKDMQRKKNDVKVRTTLLLSLPDEHQLRFSKYKTAKELWAAILKTFGGNEATKKRKNNLLKQQYGNFKAEGSKTLEQTFNRLQVIVIQLQFMDVEVEKDDLNQKFLTSLAPEWLMHTIKKSNSNSQNMAFISSSKHSNGDKDGNTACVSTSSTTFPTASASVATISQDTASAYIASQSSGSQIKFEDINQIDEDDMEEMDIKWSMALLSMRADKFWKRTGKKIGIQGSYVAGFDKSNVECFNCHKMGQFRELDNLGKFEAKRDEGYFIRYSMSSKAFRVFNKRTRRVEENLHVEFLENKAIEKGTGPNWLFDIDSLTKSMNYVPVDAEPSSKARLISKRVANQEETPSLDNILSLTNRFEDILGVTTSSNEAIGVEADVSNIETTISASPTPTLRIHKDHPKSQIIGPVDTPIQTRHKSKEEELLQFKIQNVWTLVDCPKGVRPIGTKWVLKNKKDERGIVVRNKAKLVAQGHTQEEGIDYDKVFLPVTRIEAIRLFLAYASFMGFTVYQMDVKSAFHYGTIDEEVYVMQPPGF